MKNTDGWIFPEGYDGPMPTKQDDMEPQTQPAWKRPKSLTAAYDLLTFFLYLIGALITLGTLVGLVTGSETSAGEGIAGGLIFIACGVMNERLTSPNAAKLPSDWPSLPQQPRPNDMVTLLVAFLRRWPLFGHASLLVVVVVWLFMFQLVVEVTLETAAGHITHWLYYQQYPQQQQQPPHVDHSLDLSLKKQP